MKPNEPIHTQPDLFGPDLCSNANPTETTAMPELSAAATTAEAEPTHQAAALPPVQQSAALQLAPLAVHTVPLGGRNLIEASAGTGKTFNITGLYARLVLGAHTDAEESGAATQFDLSRALLPEQILVVTFTKAATAELKDRIRTRLAQLAQTLQDESPVLLNGEPEPFCATLWAQIVAQGVAVKPLLDQLRLALATLDQAAISTIHSFCQRLLTEQAFEAGFDFDREMISDESEVLAQIARDFWRSEVYPADPIWVNYLAQVSVGRTKGLGVDALARMAHRWAGLDEARLDPLPACPELGQVAARWQQAVAACAGLWAPEQLVPALTILHTQGLLKKNKLGFLAEAGWTARIEAYFAAPNGPLPAELKALAQTALNDAVLKKHQDSVPHDEFFAAVEALIDTRTTLEQDLALYLAHWLLGFGRYVRRELALRKAAAGQMSFDDSLNLLASALQDERRRAHLVAKVRQKYRAALVDEFQDTDPTQFCILDTLFGAPRAADTGEQAGIDEVEAARSAPPFFMVGDPKQAIYAFRGADVYAYLQARQAATGRYSIDTNFRSDAAIIAFINRLFAPADAFVEAQIQHPEIKAKHSGPSKLQIADHRQAVHAFVYPAPKAEAARQLIVQGVTQEIVQLLQRAAAGQATLGERPLAPGDIAILVSSHRDAEQLRRALLRAGVPSVTQVRESVFAAPEAQGLLALLLAINEPANPALLRRALVSPVVGLSVAQLIALQADEAAWLAQIEQLQTLRDEWRKAGFMAMFRRWLVHSGTPARLLGFADGERRLTNLLHVAELIQHEARARPSPALLLAWLDRQIAEPDGQAENQQMRLESDAERVKIVTIHASKGLEYPVVFCPLLWRGPAELSRDGQLLQYHTGSGEARTLLHGSPEARQAAAEQARLEGYAEQLRLLYVALTRAKHRLYLAYPNFTEKLHTASKPALNNAALAQVLRVEGATLHSKIGEWSASELAGALQALGPVSISDLSELPLQARYQPPAVQQPTLAVAQLPPRPWAAPWRLVSFSSLSRGVARHGSSEQAEHAADHDRDVLPTLSSERLGPLRFRFTRGADAGTALHGMFEHWDFTQPERQQWWPVIAQQLQQAGLLPSAEASSPADVPEEGMLSDLADWLGEVLDTPIGVGEEPRFTLASLSRRQRLNEWPFLLHCPTLDLRRFCAVLAEPQYGVPAAFIAASQRLKPEQIEAYLNGVIDLVAVHAGRYYIVDYKSNHLGASWDDYQPARLTEAMADAHYYLQYLLYVVAWHRYLRQRLGAAYDYQRDFGGVMYLFIRGMHPEAKESGIWQHKPPVGLIEALDAVLGAQHD
ncbi:exodeoxyribonuclease V subunit beta [Chitinibacter tainanensis]|uniref:exodeoxyribonuclease V subunit beta n=1 Tax=Chitinibacter tainanensis TaxID=230667 RepID=UPI0003F50C76|nr:exodeoxyribonuclease V subunit beta [Chitinibacter tainanensis]